MPRAAKELTQAEVDAITRPGYHHVGGVPGLVIQITPSGGRSWLLRVRIEGKSREIGLGGTRTVSLAAARAHALPIYHQARRGLPLELESAPNHGKAAKILPVRLNGRFVGSAYIKVLLPPVMEGHGVTADDVMQAILTSVPKGTLWFDR